MLVWGIQHGKFKVLQTRLETQSKHENVGDATEHLCTLRSLYSHHSCLATILSVKSSNSLALTRSAKVLLFLTIGDEYP